MNVQENKKFINDLWEDSIIPTLKEYIQIPNKSPLFDPKWQEHGYMDQAVELLKNWADQHAVKDMSTEIVRLPNRTPLLLIEIPGNSDETILLYGHLDKQPEMTGWDPDLGPWKPVLKQDKLYGRGAADDGYALFASLAAIKSLHHQKLPHARCIILIEACEESGSRDLPYYIEALKERIGEPSLIICLDSGCGNYDQLWVTTSLRGILNCVLHIDVLKQGMHSGTVSGIVPSCFTIMRQILDRLEDKNQSEILLKELFVDIPAARQEQVKKTALVLGKKIFEDCALINEVQPVTPHLTELLLNGTWRPALSVTGIDGLPKIENAGNVTIPWIKIKLSLRTPPTLEVEEAIVGLKKMLEKDPPFNARIKLEIKEAANGWNAPLEKAWLTQTLNDTSQNYFSAEAMYMGEGGSIPFMGMLGKKFPNAQFVITGVLGPESNAHGPNEFLHIPTGKKLTCCIAEIVVKHFQRNSYGN